MKLKKLLLFGALAAVLVLAGGFVGYRAYKSARQSKLIQQAKTYLAKPNERKALLCLQRALRYNPKDVEACRLMAQLAERANSPGALIWRNKVVELEPNSATDRLALVQSALRFRDLATATNALEKADSATRKTAGYHNVAGAVDIATANFRQAEGHFSEASRLEPDNPVPRINLAVVRLHGTNEQARATSRATLSEIASTGTNGPLRCLALRELAVDTMRLKKPDAALTLCNQLIQDTNSAFSDRLLWMEVLSVAKSNEIKNALAACQREAGTNSAKIFELSMWEITRFGPTNTLAWLNKLPDDCKTNMPTALIMAECLAATRDWKDLQAFLEKQYWTDPDHARHAFNALAFRGQKLDGAAKAEWEAAATTARDNALRRGVKNSHPLYSLLQYTARWGWQSESEDLLWTIVNNFPDDRRARQTLTEVLYAGGRTRALLTFFTQELKRIPDDLSVKNNLAVTALLLDARDHKPHELAHDVYQKAPTNAAFASTYAFSLYLQQKPAEAVKVMQAFPAKVLENPAIAGYYGLFLKAAGQGAQAKPYFQAISKTILLPEEKRLFEKAASGA